MLIFARVTKTNSIFDVYLSGVEAACTATHASAMPTQLRTFLCCVVISGGISACKLVPGYARLFPNKLR